jgi:probable F420-dependent oxidoreductase
MKIRVGIGLGVRTTLNDEGFLDVVDALEELHYDSLWLSERIGGEAPDPIVAMSVAAARTKKLKFGTSVMVLPGRNPILLAKELATLDRMSKGRVLPAFGLGAVDPHEQQAFGVVREERAKRFDEALRVMRACWTEDSVTHHGTYFHYDDVRVLPKPIQQPIDVWSLRPTSKWARKKSNESRPNTNARSIPSTSVLSSRTRTVHYPMR